MDVFLQFYHILCKKKNAPRAVADNMAYIAPHKKRLLAVKPCHA
jgi:hypothetical protein